MFSKTLCIALLSLTLSSFTAQAAPSFNREPECGPASVSIRTVTVTATAPASESTTKSSNHNNFDTINNSGHNFDNNSNSHNKNTNSKGSFNSKDKGHSHDKETGKGQKKGSLTSTGTGSQATTGSKGVNNSGSSTSVTSAASSASSTSAAPPTNNTNETGTIVNSTSSGDIQSSLTLDPSVLATGFENNGQDVPEAGQVASLTSSNNFINFCATVPNLPITNGKQITTGSCNPAPIGIIPSTANMPSSKFDFPPNFGIVKANTAFTITMNIARMETGFFVNAQENYFAAPQFLNAQGQIQGHSHVVIEAISAIDQTTTTDPTKFAFFKGLNAVAVNGQLTADVTNGLPAGFYKLSSINSAANHQPVIVPVAQHGSLDDVIYFTVNADGAAATNSTASAPPAAASTTTVSSVAAGEGASVVTAAPSVAATAKGVVVSQAPIKGVAQPAKGLVVSQTPIKRATPLEPPARGVIIPLVPRKVAQSENKRQRRHW